MAKRNKQATKLKSEAAAPLVLEIKKKNKNPGVSLAKDSEPADKSETDLPVAANKAEAEPPVAANKAEAEPPVAANKAEAEPPVTANKAEAEPPVAADKAEAEPPVAANKAEAEPPVAADKAEAEPPVAANKAEAEPPVAANKAEAEPPVAADKAEAEPPVATNKAEAESAAAVDKAEVEQSATVAKPAPGPSVKNDERSTASVVGMAAVAVVLMAAIGYWGYFVTPTLKNAPNSVHRPPVNMAAIDNNSGAAQPQPNSAPARERPVVSEQSAGNANTATDPSAQQIAEMQNEVKISDLEMSILTPPIYRKVDNPIVQRDITVSQYMYARDYLSFSGADGSAIDEFDGQAQKLANSGSDPDGKEQDKLVKQAEETAVSLLKKYFSSKLDSSKVKNKEKLAAEADQYFAMGDISNGVRTYETACGLNKKGADR